jgi:hypothetical protein
MGSLCCFTWLLLLNFASPFLMNFRKIYLLAFLLLLFWCFSCGGFFSAVLTFRHSRLLISNPCCCFPADDAFRDVHSVFAAVASVPVVVGIPAVVS